MLQRILIKKNIKGNACSKKFEKISIVIKNVIESEDTLMHIAEHPSKYFFQHFHT